jgi:hypothetical protein
MRLVFRDHVSGLGCWVRCISIHDRSSHANPPVEPNATSNSQLSRGDVVSLGQARPPS